MIVREFIPGTEWLYLKIYTGSKTADVILSESLEPLIKKLQGKSLIEKWFFIRYNDPKPHLRVRFRLIELSNYSEILENINVTLKIFIDSGEIANIVFDTYKREIERYGENTIESAEGLFCKSSELILNFLEYDNEEKIIVTLFYIDYILSELKISREEKFVWINDFNNAFKKEFNADKNLSRQLDKKYRKFKPTYLNFTNSDEFKEIRKLMISNIKESNSFLRDIQYSLLYISLSDFFQSIFHMHINRVFTSEQRLFEMIIYDYLFRKYKEGLFINHKN